MPARTATRKSARPASRRKTSTIGSARKETVASRRAPGTGAKVARGIHGANGPRELDPTMHAKKAPRNQGRTSLRPGPRTGGGATVKPRGPARSRTAAGGVATSDPARYVAMRDIILGVIPNKAPGMTQGEMFEAVRDRAPRSIFPGATDRSWAKSVQQDLESKGVLRRTEASPVRWYKL